NLESTHPVGLAADLLFRQAAGAMDLGARHLTAGHVERQHIDEAVGADAATDLDRRAFGQVARQALDPAFTDADAVVGLWRLSLQHFNAHAPLVLGHRAVDPAGCGRQLRVLGDQYIIHAAIGLLDLDAQTVGVDVDFDDILQQLTGVAGNA